LAETWIGEKIDDGLLISAANILAKIVTENPPGMELEDYADKYDLSEEEIL